jgi:hypothetical protein
MSEWIVSPTSNVIIRLFVGDFVLAQLALTYNPIHLYELSAPKS